MHIDPLSSEHPAIVYIDFKSPYAYLAVEPIRELERTLGVQFDWRPFVLDIPSYLGSARLDASGGVLEQNRSEGQWAGVKYAYYDCRRYANLRGQTIRGTVKIWDTTLVSTALLWCKRYGYDTQQGFIDAVYQPFWCREFDAESEQAVGHVLDDLGADAKAFMRWAAEEGFAANAELQSAAFAAGIYGVPTLVVNSELYFGREHLPRIAWQLEGELGAAPDIANPLPASVADASSEPERVTIGIDNSYDSVLAVPQLIQLLADFNGSVDWVLVDKSDLPSITLSNDSPPRSVQHRQWRELNQQRDSERYDTLALGSTEYLVAAKDILASKQISLSAKGPQQLTQLAMPGIVVLIDDELFIGRQHLPLITARLGVGQ